MSDKNHLLRPYFLIALILLIVNDFFLKSYFHNSITGKLSDIAGLFAFPFFLSIFVGRKRNIKTIYLITGLFFIFWKSEYSSGFIDFINRSPLHLGRIVDYTDLWALMVLPLSYSYRVSGKAPVRKWYPLGKYAVFLVACFSFMATSSFPTEVPLKLKSNKTYSSSQPLDSIKKKMNLYRRYDGSFESFLNISKSNSRVFLTVKLDTSNVQQTLINLDSILYFRHRSYAVLSFMDTSKRDLKYMGSLGLKDYEKLFEEYKIKPLINHFSH